MRHQNRIRMDIVMQILYLVWDPTDFSFICGITVIFSITKLYLFLKKTYISNSNLLAHCGLTCVEFVLFRAVTCTVTEVANGNINASNKELQVCVW